MNTKTRNTLFTYFFLLLTFFVGVLFTKTFYGQYVENKNSIENLEKTLQEKQIEYNTLAELKQKIDAGEYSEMNLESYAINFSEDELTNYFYSYATSNAPRMRIESLSLDEGRLNDFWFKEWTINITATFQAEENMTAFISSLIWEKKYKFFVHTLNYPLWEITGPFMVDIPVKVLYK